MKKYNHILAALAFALFAQAAFAAGGLGGAETFLNNISTWLKALAGIVLTIALIVAGYKIMWGGSTVREVAPVVIGGIVIGSATYIAGLVI